jgi:hypothetical protein
MMYQIAQYHNVDQQATALFEAIATRHHHVLRVMLALSQAVYGDGAWGARPDRQAC